LKSGASRHPSDAEGPAIYGCGCHIAASGNQTIERRAHLPWQSDDAWRCIHEAITAIETAKATWFEAEVNRIGGEIALNSPAPDVAKAEENFERAVAIAREQQAKSWELRAAMSMARLWCDQGKRDEAREVLAPVYGWFTEAFDTFDLKEAKACSMSSTPDRFENCMRPVDLAMFAAMRRASSRVSRSAAARLRLRPRSRRTRRSVERLPRRRLRAHRSATDPDRPAS
jgi:hypothetical protein